MPADPNILEDITRSLADRDYVSLHRYDQWESAFIARWGCLPRDNGMFADLYLRQRDLHGTMLSFHAAARAFHTNALAFKSQDQMRAFIDDYATVADELMEGDLTQEDWDRLEQDHLLRNPETKKVIDMAPGSLYVPPTSGLVAAERIEEEEFNS